MPRVRYILSVLRSFLIGGMMACVVLPAYGGDADQLAADVETFARCSGVFEVLSGLSDDEQQRTAYQEFSDSLGALASIQGEFAVHLGVGWGRDFTAFVENERAHGRTDIIEALRDGDQFDYKAVMTPCVLVLTNLAYYERMTVAAADALASIGINQPTIAEEFVATYPNSSFTPLIQKKLDELHSR